MTASTNLIKLLPEYISNQIAAGEVVQRPSNIIKELVENSIDAGATSIDIVLQHGGKSYIEVADNGSGIGNLDARMAFERHATSKISSLEDLFSIRTMGFRGEALAAIAAVAQVQMITKTAKQEMATKLIVEQGRIVKQESFVRDVGTTMVIKNLFFHVPARKHFLKTDQTELKHIVSEFLRIVLAYPQISFTLKHGTERLFKLEATSLKQRIVHVFGNHYEKHILPVQESMEGFSLTGFIGSPSVAKKTRDDCFLIVNHRFVRSPIIHKAIVNAYEHLIAGDQHPFYVLDMTLNPSSIDINIHPSKQEIKFADEKWIFTFVQAQVKYALAKNNITQPIQFDLDHHIQSLPVVQSSVFQQPIEKSAISHSFSTPQKAHYLEKDWQKDIQQLIPNLAMESVTSPALEPSKGKQLLFSIEKRYTVTQLLGSYLLLDQEGELFLIDQQFAHERILYHFFLEKMKGNETAISMQTLTQPIMVSLSPTDMLLAEEYAKELHRIGFQVERIGPQDMALYAVPSHISHDDIERNFSTCVHQIAEFSDLQEERKQQIASMVAKTYAFKRHKKLSPVEQDYLVKTLFNVDNYTHTPDGHLTIKKIDTSVLAEWLQRR